VVLVTLWLQVTSYPVVADWRERIEWLVYDLRFDLSRPFAESESAEPGISVVDIDERSLRAEGRWPWPREKVAELIDAITNRGAVVVGLDTVFAEPERNPAEQLLGRSNADLSTRVSSRLQQWATRLDGDSALAESFRGREIVTGYFLTREGAETGVLGPPLADTGLPPPHRTPVPTLNHAVGNLAVLQEAAASAGFLTSLPDADGILRRYPLILGHQGRYYPSLALAMARRYLLVEDIDIASVALGSGQAIDRLGLGGREVKTTADGAVLIPYRNGDEAVSSVSATDVLAERVASDRFAGQLVLVGSSASGIGDLKATPLHGAYPGVAIHATVLAGLLEGQFPAQPHWAPGANFAFMLGLGLLIALLMPYLRSVKLAAVTGVMAVLLIVVNALAWYLALWILPLALPLLMLAALAMVNLSYGFLVEERRRRQLKTVFSEYVPPSLVDQLSQDPAFATRIMAGERREMTVLFADIRGFSSISESLAPADLKALLNRFFTPLTRVIFEAGGTIDKYVGDMVMAFWGAPLADDHHAIHAVTAALNMQREAERLRHEMPLAGYPAVMLGIGLNSGPMNVGDMGSEYRRSYTVLGDAVNLGSRLEGLTKHYGVHIVVGETTWTLARDAFVFRCLDRVRVKGRDEALTIYEPMAPAGEASEALRAEVAAHEAALAAYWRQDWQTAKDGFDQLAAHHPEDPLYRLFLDRIDALVIDEPPPGWDGVFQHQAK